MATPPENNQNNSNPLRDTFRLRREIEEALRAVHPVKKYLPPSWPRKGNDVMVYLCQILFLEEALTAWDHNNYEEAARMFSHARDILDLDPDFLLRAYHEACNRRQPPQSRGVDPHRDTRWRNVDW